MDGRRRCSHAPNGTDGYYAAGFDNNDFSTSDGTYKCRIWKYIIVGGVHQAANLAVDATCHIAVGDTLRLEVQGSTLKFYQNGVLKLLRKWRRRKKR